MSDNTCTATTRAGAPCRRKKVHGSDKCQAHGGAKHKPNDIVAKALDGIEKPRCKYTKRNGEQCKQSPIKGGTVCKKHGGAAAHVQRKARMRMIEAVDPILAKFIRLAMDDSTPLGDVYRFGKEILDRSSLVPKTGVAVAVEVEVKPWEKTMESILTEVSFDALGSMEDIEDAEVVEESLPPVEDRSRHEGFTGPRINHEGRLPTRTVIGSANPPERRSGRDDY